MKFKPEMPKNRRQLIKALLAIALLSVFLAVVTTYGVRQYYVNNLKPLNSSQATVSITIPDGATLRESANLLKQQKIIKNAWAFERYVRNKDASDKIKAGTYNLSPSYSVQEIVSIITEGKVATNLITILPGRRLDEIKAAFRNAGYGQTAIDAAFAPEQYESHPALADKPVGTSLEGYLYPESFQRTADTKPETIIKKSLDEMQKRLTPELREAFVKRGLTIHQAVTLASIVEREVSRPEDRPAVAQVFLKRLNINMRLESDVTAVYAYTVDKKPPSLSYDSPYNTLIHSGLPPGPISNVTENSLKAVAYPSSTDWLYFVSGDPDQNGVSITYFSRTLEEHQALTAQYCKKLCGQIPN